jgi:uncharacterized protein
MSRKPSLDEILDLFDMQPLPVEGGFFTRTYLANEIIPHDALPDRYPDEKHFGTAILYLLTADPDCFSAIHRLPTDEIFHFYLGDPVEMLQLFPDGSSCRIVLGSDILTGQRIQHAAPRGVWQGSRLIPGGEYALLGTTMAPGFTDNDYFGGDRDELIMKYPNEAEMIRALTRPEDPRRRLV